jgi:hypothetical protein
MKTTLAICSLLALAMPGIARAEDTFETKAAGAQRIHRIENVVWALTAACDQGDDTEQRQCRIVRDRRATELAGATLFVDADKDAFDVAAWNPAKKSSTLSVTSCIRCAGVDLDGKTWLVTGGTGAPKIEGGKIRPTTLADTARGFVDQAAAQAFAKQTAEARVQMLVKVPAKARWADAGKQGIALEIVAFRVVAPCDGSVILSNVPSGPAEADKKACGPVSNAKPIEGAASADTLSMTAIKDAMKPVVLAGAQCFSQFAIAGSAKIKLTVNGDGTIAKYEQQGDFVGTPTGECIDKAIKNVSFPKVKKPQTSFTFPLQLK